MVEPAKNPSDQQIGNVMDTVLNKKFTAGTDIELNAIEDVPVEVTVVLGGTSITVEQLLKMGKGAVIELERKVGEPVELYVNERCVAKGEIVVVDNKIGVTMTEIIKDDKE